MKHLSIIGLVLVLVLLAGCSGDSYKPGTMPAELPGVAAEFKAKAGGGDRKALAELIMKLMPTCVGQVGEDGFSKISYDEPTYFMSGAQVQQLLGTADEVSGELLVYKILKERRTQYEMVIDFYDGHVISARIEGSYKR